MEDMRHMTVLEGLAREIQDLIRAYNEEANGITDKEMILDIRLRQNQDMIDLLSRQRRALEFMAGREVAPMTHFAEVILVGVGTQQ